MKTLLVPIDLSEKSKFTVIYAMNLLLYFKLILSLVHIIKKERDALLLTSENNPYSHESLQEYLEDKKIEIKEFQTFIDSSSDLFKVKPEVHIKIYNGEKFGQILGAAKENNAELIVLTAKDSTNETSNTNVKLMEEADIPVLIVPPGVTFKPIKKIVYTSDGFEKDLRVLEQLIQFADPFNALISALYISDSIGIEEKQQAYGNEKRLREELGYELFNTAIMPGKDTVETVNFFVERDNPDLVVVQKKDRSFIQKVFTSSNAEKLLAITNLPFLIYP